MLNFDTQPSPPTPSSEMLREVANYYHQLVEYHQRAAAMAAGQLEYVTALLHPDSRNVLRSQIPEHIPDRESTNNGHGWQLSGEKQLPELPSADKLEATTLPVQTQNEESPISRTSDIATILEGNRGKIVHLDYIVRKLYGNLDHIVRESIACEIAKLLEVGESKGLWDSVPDSPSCWTIDLLELSDFAKSSSKIASSNGKTSKPKATGKNSRTVKRKLRFPPSAQIGNMSLTEAVGQSIKELYPKTASANEIISLLYPEGLPEEERKQVRKAIGDVLNKGCGFKGWQRVKIGQYIWDESR